MSVAEVLMQAMAEQIGAESVDDFDERAEELAIIEIHYDACRQYLNEGETPAQCIQRNRDDVGLALGELARCKGDLQEARKTVIWLGVCLLLAAVLFVVERWP